MSYVIDQIRAAVRKAEDRAQRAFDKRLQAEETRHAKRIDELKTELTAELEVARAALKVLPEEAVPVIDDLDARLAAPEPAAEWDAEDQALAMASRPELEAHVEDEPELTEVPAALREPYAPSERLTGKARSR